jgi:hypothetical protein
MSAFPIFGIGNGGCFNNKLSFLKSMTTLIVDDLFFLGIVNHVNKEAHSEE